jgi:nitroreductase
VLFLEKGKAKVMDDDCLACGHCQAVCPENAVKAAMPAPRLEDFSRIEVPEKPFAPGSFSAKDLVGLMLSRRSCRRFSEKEVEKELLWDLARVGVTAPSGTNSQGLCFTVLGTRKAVIEWAEAIGFFFKKLNRLAERSLLRRLLKALGRSELHDYYLNHYQSVKDALGQWEEKGVDRLFHGAQAVMIVSSLNSASCPAEDALLASQNILLASHSLGLGTCLIGFAVAAMKKDPSLARMVGIGQSEKAYAVIALGYPSCKYLRFTSRKEPVLRFKA